jgi:hypothetical protein
MMNFVIFSPHFPPNYYPFCVKLKQMGVNVLGLADASYDELRPELKAALTEYYRVNNANNYEELLRSLGYFTHRFGKIDRLESQNEYWLESDARLRTDFNIPGLRTQDMPKLKQKSEMKKIFNQANIPAARGQVSKKIEEVKELISEWGYPIVAKPDIGVGAYRTYKISNDSDLGNFFQRPPLVDYIFEEFISGTIQTFDGLTNQNGEIVFSSSMEYSEGVMDLVNQNLDFWYYTQRNIPKDLESYGQTLVEVYQTRERFFHFEFFRKPEGQLIALEVNMRPPGGLTTDMWNYANDINIYYEYANVVVNNQFSGIVNRPYYVIYIGRRNNKLYRHSHQEVMTSFPGKIVHHEPISGIFASAIGDYGYLARSSDLTEVEQIAQWVLEKA